MALSDNNSGWYAGKIIKRLLNKAHTSRFEISNDLPDAFSSFMHLLPENFRLIERTSHE
jgi:hypothetical protein